MPPSGGGNSRQKVEGDTYEGPRAQKTVRATGARPGVLQDPEPPTIGYVAVPGPLLAAPVLAGGDGPDASALAFLVRQAVLAQEEMKRVKEEEARRRQEERLEAQGAEEWAELVDERTGKTYFFNPQMNATTWTLPAGSTSSSLPGRKRKKKKKRRRRRRTFLVFWEMTSCILRKAWSSMVRAMRQSRRQLDELPTVSYV